MTKLKSCPFCGSNCVNDTTDPVADDHDCYTWVCPCCISVGPIAESVKDATDAWNDRADGWISVDDTNPKQNGYDPSTLIISVDFDSGAEALFYGGKYYWGMDELDNLDDIKDVTHWQYHTKPKAAS